MHFKIHRGASEIGGSCVEVWTETTHVVIDFGMPLVNPDKTKFDSSVLVKFSREELVAKCVLPDIPGLYGAETDKEFALSCRMRTRIIMDWLVSSAVIVNFILAAPPIN